MIRHSRNGVVEEVAIMIRTGASEEAVDEYVYNLYISEQITERVYSLLLGMIANSF